MLNCQLEVKISDVVRFTYDAPDKPVSVWMNCVGYDGKTREEGFERETAGIDLRQLYYHHHHHHHHHHHLLYTGYL